MPAGPSIVLLLGFLGAAITYLDRAAIAAAAPGMMTELGLTSLQMGYVFSVFQVAYGVMEIPMGWLGDRFGQRVVLTRIVASWSLFTLLTGAVRGFGGLLSVRFLFGAAEAGAFPNLARAMGRWFPAQQRARAQGVLWMGARTGGALAPPLMVVLMQALGWRLSFSVLCILGLVWCAAFWGIYRDTGPASAPALHRPPATPWALLLRSRNLWALCGMYFSISYGFHFFLTWLPTYLLREHGLGLGASGFFSSVPLAAGAVGCATGGVVADWLVRRTSSVRWGRASVGIAACLLGAFGFAAAALARGPIAAVAALSFAQWAVDLSMSVSWASSVDIGGPYGSTTAAFMNTASCVSAALSPVSAIWLAGVFGSFRAMLLVAACLYFAAALLWLVIDPSKPVVEEKVLLPCVSH